MSDRHGMVWWSELMTRDVDAAKSYYSSICGWAFETMPMAQGDYHVASRDGVPTAGIMDMSGVEHLNGLPAHWFTYLAVDDVDAAVQATEAGGGRIDRQPYEVPNVGRIAIVTDPSGATLGIMTPAAPPS